MLISSKLLMPALKTGLLPRDGLVRRLSQGADKRLVLVSGPAGSGKTSLVCQWIGQEGLPVAWYSLDEADNDTQLFFQYLLTVLGRLDGRIDDGTKHWRSNQREEASPLAVASLLIELLSHLSEDVYIVLDNYHLIASRQVHAALTYLLERMPEKAHLVIMTRYAVRLPVSRLRVRGQTVEICSRDLRFTYGETERFFREVYPTGLSAGQVQELNRRMEGLVAGLQLFAMSSHGRSGTNGFQAALNKACFEAMDYLIDEVVGLQSEEVRSFLYATALLDRFNADLCSAVTGRPNAAETLGYVLRNDLFLFPLEPESTWYRYHHLFYTALRKKAAAASPEACGRVHWIAALWLAREGHVEDAFRQAFATRDMEFAADLLEDHMMDLYRKDEVASCRHWLSKLPHSTFLKRPFLRVLDFRFRIRLARLSSAETILGDIEQELSLVPGGKFTEVKRKFCEDSLALFRTIVPSWLRPETANVAGLEEVAASLDSEDRSLAGMVRILIAASYLHRGRVTLALRMLNAAPATSTRPESLYPPLLWFRMTAHVERFHGHLRRSEAAVKDALSYLDRTGLAGTRRRRLLFLPLAWISYFRNDIDQALDYATDAARFVEQAGFTYEIVEVNHLLALIYTAMGEVGKSQRCMARMEREAASMGMPGLIRMMEAYAARLHMAHGNLDRAERWAVQRNLKADEPLTFRFVQECLTQAGIFCAQGLHSKAIRLLEKLNGLCARYGMMEAVLEINLLSASAFLGTGSHRHATAMLDRALNIGRPEEYVRPFVSHSKVLTPLLIERIIGEKRSTPDLYIRKILKCSGVDVNKIPAYRNRMKGTAGLTQREMDILRMMANGFDNREIAEKAFISLNTVKTHAKHIFAKLDARTRVQAIKRADELEPANA